MEKILNGLKILNGCVFRTATFQHYLLLKNSALSKINQWFLANKLSLNVTKQSIHISIKLVKKTTYHKNYQGFK